MNKLAKLSQRRLDVLAELIAVRAELNKLQPCDFARERDAIMADPDVPNPHKEWKEVREEMNQDRETLIDEKAKLEKELVSLSQEIGRSLPALSSVGPLTDVPVLLQREDGFLDYTKAFMAILAKLDDLSTRFGRIEKMLDMEEEDE